jgi:hypothetical protein
MTYQPAVAKIISSEKQGDILRTTLRLDRIPSPPIAPASLHQLDGNWTKVLDLHKLVRRIEDILTFETYEREVMPLPSGNTYTFTNWWRPDQLEIAQYDSRLWQKRSFIPKDLVLFGVEGRRFGRQAAEGEVVSEEETRVKDGWDHEHCFLCWRTISTNEEEPHEGHTDGTIWLCETCYQTYIASGFSKSLGEQIR